MRHRKHRKLFFPFGMISLAFLPVLGFHKIAEIYKIRTAPLHCLELHFPTSDTISYGHQKGKTIYEIRKLKHFALSADTRQNDIVLNQSREVLNKIKGNLDTVNGIHITISDSTKYKDYIKAVNYSFEEFPAVFGSYKNDFWSFYVDFDTTDIPKETLAKWKKQYKKFNCR